MGQALDVVGPRCARLWVGQALNEQALGGVHPWCKGPLVKYNPFEVGP